MSDICRMCGLPFSEPSFGGPGVCPACDCGITTADTVKRQAAKIARLTAEVERLRGLISAFLTAYDDVILYTTTYLNSGGTPDRMPKHWHTLDTRRSEAIAAMQAALAEPTKEKP